MTGDQVRSRLKIKSAIVSGPFTVLVILNDLTGTIQGLTRG